MICGRFPNYGYYNIPSIITGQIADAELTVGDAIDDLIDITTELRTISNLWREEGDEAAIRSFTAAHRFHLGGHLRALQLYLDSLTIEEGGL